MQVASVARKRQIVVVLRTAMLLGDYVLNVMSQFREILMNKAVLTPVTCP